MPKRYERYLIPAAYVIVLLILVVAAYTVGRFNGFVTGTNSMLKSENRTMCMFLSEKSENGIIEQNITVDEQGNCVMEARYATHLQCFWGNITATGEKPGWSRVLAQKFENPFAYISLGCRYN